jgi:hypothetical protein
MDTVLRNIAMYRKIVADANAKAKLSEWDMGLPTVQHQT